MRWLIVGIGGGLGAMLRYGAAGLVQNLFGSHFPWGTLCVNVTGSFLIGVVLSFFEIKGLSSTEWRLFLTVGILGGFTTYSTFSAEVLSQIRDGEFFFAGYNVGGTIFLVLIGCWLGDTITRFFLLGASS